MMKIILVLCLVSLAAFGESEDCNRRRMKMHFHGKGDSYEGGLKMNFYGNSCPQAEMLVRNITWTLTAADPDLAAYFLRLHYHDCFVRGCDASLLLDTTNAGPSEKETEDNKPLEGFDEIDEIKSRIEKECPGIVSCADIVALAARDGVSFQFRKSMWDVLTGRRDGTKSVAADVAKNLPSAFSDFAALQRLFSSKGLDVKDLVALSGAHTIGHAHCNSFAKRLYNFTGKGDADPSLDAVYAKSLRKKCPNPFDPQTIVMMDLRTPDSFDGAYYKNLFHDEGLFKSDASLLTNGQSASIARQLQDNDRFFAEFAYSMKNMGAIQVLTGSNGEIRRQCRVVNRH
ncbi:peroxidase 24-like [Magnolia sinica]|uniref:peroxidase 24-like n=1 Tax=Magnolia sinica TaxID=86752 RepID=UPI002657E97A|nr:peroxidase 24-like [Magnolia sinica]